MTADRRRLGAIVGNRNVPQKHAWRAEIVLLTADGWARSRSSASHVSATLRWPRCLGKVCVVDPQGRGVVESHPAVISQHLLGLGPTLGRVGLKAGGLVLDLPAIAAAIIPLLAARSALRVQLAKLHKMLLDEVRPS